MKITRNVWLLVVLGIVALLYFSHQNSIPKEAVADIQGKACKVASDCPCIGTYDYNNVQNGPSAYGIGVGKCTIPAGATEGACDMGLCVDVAPVGTWVQEHPLAWLKTGTNVIYLFALLGAALIYFMLPKN